MLIGRFLFLLPLLAAAGSLAAKKKVATTSGTFPTHGALFVGLLVGTVVIVGALTFFPALSLGPYRGALPDASRKAVLISMSTTMTPPKITPTRPAAEDLTSLLPKKLARARPLFDTEIAGRALKESFVKLNPVTLAKNPVIFVVEVGAALTTIFLVRDLFTGAERHSVLRSDRAVAVVHRAVRQLRRSHGRGARQSASRYAAENQTDTIAKRINPRGDHDDVPASKLRAGDVVICETGDIIPGDGEVIEGIATVDESVITGESAPVIRESGGDRNAVTGGTRVLSDMGQDQDHFQSGRDVSGSHDRAGGRRRTPEDSQRNRVEYPDRRTDPDFPAGGDHAAALRRL